MAAVPHDVDSKLGVVRELVDDYRHNGGAVIIPSHSGEHGDRLRPRKPHTMVIDPGTAGEITVSTVQDGHRILGGGRTPPTPAKSADTPDTSAVAALPAEVIMPKKKAQRIIAAKTQKKTQISRAPERIVRDTVVTEPQAMNLVVASTEVVAARALPTDEQAVAGPPDVEVEFTLPGGGKLTSRYHHVLVDETSNLLVLVYNRNFKYGSLFSPPTTSVSDPDDRLTLQVGENDIFTVGHVGIQFPFNEWEFIVMMIIPPNQEPQK